MKVLPNRLLPIKPLRSSTIMGKFHSCEISIIEEIIKTKPQILRGLLTGLSEKRIRVQKITYKMSLKELFTQDLA